MEWTLLNPSRDTLTTNGYLSSCSVKPSCSTWHICFGRSWKVREYFEIVKEYVHIFDPTYDATQINLYRLFSTYNLSIVVVQLETKYFNRTMYRLRRAVMLLIWFCFNLTWNFIYINNWYRERQCFENMRILVSSFRL